MLAACKLAEIEYVLVHSSTGDTLDPVIAGEIVAGTRPRISFAPMVITTGNLMAFEALSLVLGRASGTDCRGWFLDPWRGRIERPRPAPVAWLLGFWVRREMRRLLGGS